MEAFPLSVEEPEFVPLDLAFLAPPHLGSHHDPILDSPWARHPLLEPRVAYWIERWRRRGVFDLPVSLGRLGYYQTVVDRELEARGLPRSLRYLPVIESGYHPTAVSRVGATGLWQLMGPTARSMGLQVNALVDDRRDPFTSTAGALDYLVELNGRFGSWFLTLAAYNAGPYRVESLIRRHAPDAPLDDDATYLRIRQYLPAETRDFIPKFLAAARVGEDPEGHGFEVALEEPLTFEEVEVPDAASIDVLARAAGTSQEEFARLNPHLVRGITPVGVSTRIRVPPGRGELFLENWSQIPPSERVSFVEHRIARGETLGGIARVYGVRLADLQAANPRLDPRRLQIGQTVVIPRVPGSGARTAASPVVVSANGENGGAGAPSSPRVHVVQRGDTLGAIARRYGVATEALARANGLTLRSVIRPGDRLDIP